MDAKMIEIEHRLTEAEDRSKSNTKRLDEHDEAIKEQSELIVAIKGLAMETKYMREELNKTIKRLDKLENKNGDKWDKFKWLIVTAVVSIVLGFIAGQLNLT